ncbi:MAG: tetratricopeptide repeat protein [Alphaproteobacteria bacterium]|nr:tetratricopeptide repeat protein [Alphaproteobacteria bacterium]
MKKIIYMIMVAGVVATVFLYDTISVNVNKFVKKTVLQKQTSLSDKKELDTFLKTSRKIPETAELGAYLAGVSARNSGDFKNGIFYLEKAYLADKENEDIRRDLYALKGVSGDIQSIFDLFSKDFYKDSSLHYASELKVAQLIKEKKYQEAIDILSSFKDTSAFITALKAWCYVGLEDKNKAVGLLNSIKEESPFHQIKRYHLALVYDYFKDEKTAEIYYNQLQGLTKNISFTFYISAKDFFERKNEWNDQNVFYNQYQKLSEENPVFYDVVSQVGMPPIKTVQEAVSELFYAWGNSQGDKPDLAVLLSNTAIFLNSKHVMAKVWSAEVLDVMDLAVFAHKIYDDLLKEKPDADIVLYKKGLVYMHHGDTEGSLKIFKDLLKRNVSNPVILLLVAQGYDANGDCKSALPLYERALFLMNRWGISQTKNVKFQAAQCYLRENNFKEFEKYAYAALKEDPYDADILNYLAYEWLERDMNLKEALAFLEKAHEQAPNSPDILDSLALAYYKKGEPEKALPYAEKAVDVLGASSVANMHLGDIYQALGRIREAQSQYEKALALQFDLTPELEKKILERLQ